MQSTIIPLSCSHLCYFRLCFLPGGKRDADLYPYIFFLDLLAFFYVGLFYQAAVRDRSPFEDVYHPEDQFPYAFVAVLMVRQGGGEVRDRGSATEQSMERAGQGRAWDKRRGGWIT